MATFRAALRSEVSKNRPIPALVTEVHGILTESMDTSRFVSAVYGVLDPQSGTFEYVNCGHNPPLLLHARGDQELLRTGRPALGMFGGESTDARMVRLDEGDTLLLYTDGVVEVTDQSVDEVFGESRLARALTDSAALSASRIISALVDATRAYARRKQFDDDFTLVVVKRNRRTL
jgi:serine phosphatase RsbU (regulator of sigma subunit)